MINKVCDVNCKTVATAIAPKATCERPSPINEKRFKTSVTPNNEEHKAIKNSNN